MNDDQLIDWIARCTLRDQAALQSLYKATSAYLNRIAYNILRSEDLSNEVLQDVYVQVWQNADRYRPDSGKPLTWLGSIARYRALDRLAKEDKHRRDRSDFEITEISDLKTLFEEHAQSEKQKHFFECLETLQQRGRTCIQLAYVYGYSREELADRFDTNINTVKSWLSRNTKRLKSCLTNKGIATAS